MMAEEHSLHPSPSLMPCSIRLVPLLSLFRPSRLLFHPRPQYLSLRALRRDLPPDILAEVGLLGSLGGQKSEGGAAP